MIEIKVTRDGNKTTTTDEMDVNGTRKDAIAEFRAVMIVLRDADKKIFRDDMQKFIHEDILDMLDELDELEDGGELDD